MGAHGLTAGITLFSNRTSTFCWFNSGIQLIMEMIRNGDVTCPAYNAIPAEDKDMVCADFPLPEIVSALIFRENGNRVS